nr:uncharacterized protein LOC112038333 [Quercus suber]
MVWASSGLERIRRQSSFSDFKDLVASLLQQQTEVGLAAMMIWSIWSQRNQVRLRQPSTSLQQIVQLSKDGYSEFLTCQVPTTVRAARVKKKWKPPPADLVKINFDGATCSGTNKSGLGVVIRDSMGQVLASCSKVVNQAYNSSEVEAMAVGLVLSFAAEIGVKNAVLEGDSLLVVNALTDSESSLSHIKPLINDVKYYSYSLEKLLYSHVTRDCNSVAHSLAKHALNIQDFLVWMEETPPQVFHVLQADLAGLFQ